MAFLVVEDDTGIQRAFARILRPLGNVSLAGTLAEARIALHERAWTALFVDIGLPDGSGVELLKEAHRLARPPAALVVSGLSQGIANAAFDLGAEHVEKPVDSKRIFDFAARALSRLEGDRRRLKRVVASWQEQHALTSTETGILFDAAEGMTNHDIAEVRAIQPSTMKTHVNNLLRKTGGDRGLDGLVARVLRDVAWGK